MLSGWLIVCTIFGTLIFVALGEYIYWKWLERCLDRQVGETTTYQRIDAINSDRYNSKNGSMVYFCNKCNCMFRYTPFFDGDVRPKYCPVCGREVEYEDDNRE